MQPATTRIETPHANEDPFSQAARRCCAETACWKRLFQVFQMFQRYIASVLYRCCKSKLGCYTCCNGISSICPKYFICFRRMLQVFHLDDAKVELDVAYACMFQVFLVFHTYVAGVLSGCCICFAMAINVFSWFSDVCCNYFNCFGSMLQVFHLNIAKVDLAVVYVTVGPIYSSHLLQLLGSPACAWVWRGRHGAGAGHEAARATVRARDMV
jgi:hypothetical protein